MKTITGEQYSVQEIRDHGQTERRRVDTGAERHQAGGKLWTFFGRVGGRMLWLEWMRTAVTTAGFLALDSRRCSFIDDTMLHHRAHKESRVVVTRVFMFRRQFN